MIDRLCTFLQQDDAVLITCGYSFGDRHINERIATSLRRGGNSHVIAMYYDEFSDAKAKVRYGLADPANNVRKMATHETSGKMSVYGMRHAVIGGRFGLKRATWGIVDAAAAVLLLLSIAVMDIRKPRP